MNDMELLNVSITEDIEESTVDVTFDIRLSGDNSISIRDSVELRNRVVELVDEYNEIQMRASK